MADTVSVGNIGSKHYSASLWHALSCMLFAILLASLLSQTARLTLSAAGAAAGDVVVTTRYNYNATSITPDSVNRAVWYVR